MRLVTDYDLGSQWEVSLAQRVNFSQFLETEITLFRTIKFIIDSSCRILRLPTAYVHRVNR